LSAIANRLRAGIARPHRLMAPPPLRIIEGVLGQLDTVALGALCALDVPDRLAGPMTVTELATAIGADADRTRRLTDYAATRGWLRVDRRGRRQPNKVTEFLRREHPGGWRSWVEFAAGPDVLAAATAFITDPRAPDPFARATGAAFFDWEHRGNQRRESFDAAMAAGARMHALALAEAVEWPADTRVCDVGGGNGALLATLVARRRGLRGTVLDLPSVIAGATPQPGVDLVGGDAFRQVPSGFDTYLLVNVIHDWPDDAAVELLTAVARAVPPSGRVIVVEGERTPRPADGITVRADMLMLILTSGGQERTTDELAALGRRAGLTHERAIRLASADRAHVFRPDR
jgi:SAM-dependent methyltransferase